MVKITKLFSVSDNAKVRSLVDALEDALERVKNGNWQEYTGIIILAVRAENEKYYCGYERAGLHHSDTITLLEVAKHTMLQEMEED